jgi:glutaminyl-peptide cyclotransferase
MRSVVTAALVLLTAVLLVESGATQAPVRRLPVYGYTVVRSYPHDRAAFTQGLQYVDGVFYEGTGLNGRSSVRKVEIATGAVLQKRDLPTQYFGEGISVVKSEIYQLTWQSGIAFAYDLKSFAPTRTFKYRGEGWGLTANADTLFMSDGTEYLRLLNPATFAERSRIRVLALGAPLKNLNELEFVKGEILANVWMTDQVARIDPASGRVSGYIDFAGLLPPAQREQDAVLNGIAYDAAGDRLFVTGKLWPRVFEVRVSSSPVR